MRSILFILSFASTLYGAAQQTPAFTRFSTDDNTGLSANAVYSVYQDQKGYIWVGTANGLQRFEGNRFNLYSIEKAGNDPFPNAPLIQIIGIGGGDLVLRFPTIREIGIFNPIKLTYKKVAVKTPEPIKPRTSFWLWKDSKGELFLNVEWVGLLHYNKTENAFVNDGHFRLPKGFVPSPGALHDDAATGRVWFGGVGGIHIYDRNTRSVWSTANNPQQLPILKDSFVNDFVTQIFIDKARRHWIFGWPKKSTVGQKLHCLDSNGRFLASDTAGLLTGLNGYTEYNNLIETRRGVWVYGGNNLFRWNPARQRFQNIGSTINAANNGIEYDVVFQVLEDRDGNLWLATDKGLYFTSNTATGNAITNHVFDGSRGGVAVTDVLALPNGELWFACWGRGVIILDSAQRERQAPIWDKQPPRGFSKPWEGYFTGMWAIYHQARTGDVWMGCQAGALAVHNLRTKTNRYSMVKETGGSTIRFITEDKWGTIWIGTQSGKLLKWDGERFTVVFDTGTIIYKILIDDEGLMWLTTEGAGLFCLAPKTAKLLKRYSTEDGANALYNNSGQDIDQMKDGTLVYSGGALNFINKKTGAVKIVGFREGLPSNNVFRVRVDEQGYLWVITTNGLCRYDPFKDRITTYGKKDGVTLASRTTAADYLLPDGRVVFAGENGAILFNPKVFATAQPPPAVVITDFRIANEYVPVDSLLELPKVTLSSDQNTVGIHFSSLSFGQRDRLTYHFKLEGVDADWQSGDAVYASYYNLLPPGEYLFKVYAENIDGQRSASTTEMRLVIKPPFWKTKWFISSIVFVVLLLIYAMHRERLNKLLAVEKIRNKVARDLHDDMGSTLSTINILSSMAKSKMDSDPVKTAGYLGKISDNSQRMMEAMDDIVWSIKPSNDSMQRVTARMREFATNVLEAKDILLHFTVAEEVYAVKLNMEARRDFFLIFKEALNNAAKYAKPTEVWVEVAVKNRLLSVAIRDNGIGFDVAAADGGNGLGNMQKRADGMRGRLTIRSKKGQGTEVTLTVPVG